MKKLLIAALGMICLGTGYSLKAVRISAPFTDRSGQEQVTSNNPAVQLGAPNRDSKIYRTGWRAGRNRARWHDMQRRKSQWRKGTTPRQAGQRTRWATYRS